MTAACPSCAAPFEPGAQTCKACGRSLSTLAAGSVLASRYDLRALLDEGGAGVVYRAFDRTSEEEVAVKVFRTDLPANGAAVLRFRTEIDSAAKVSHPNVCRIRDHGEEGPFGYISMDLLAGEDLEKTLKGQPRGLPEAEVVSAVLQIASGLQAIHDAGIPHGDFKTAQAVRDPQGIVRIVPFGMLKDPLSPNLAAEAEFPGTPEYMSPEHCWGYALDFRSDVYVLGIVAFEAFTGVVPVRGKTPMDTLFKQMREAVSFEDEPGSRVPRKFVPALRRALEKPAADRFASPRELAEAFRAVAPDALIVAPSALAQEPSPAPTPESAAPIPSAPSERIRGAQDARKDERFIVPTDVRIRKLGPDGAPQKEERTIAHDLSRSGMRILTSWSDLAEGDQVSVEEVGGGFATGAIVRHVKRGTDQITRVGVEFTGKQAPDRLVGTTSSIERPAFSTLRSSSGSHRVGPGPLPPPAASGSTSRSGSFRLAPPSGTSASISRPGFAHAPAAPAPPRVEPPAPPAAPAPPARPLESILEEIEAAREAARALVADAKIWEALDCLAKAQVLAEGTPEVLSLRILTWEIQAKVPSLMRAAQQNLEDLARSEPANVAVHSALGRIYWEAGLSARARVAFTQVLALDPSNREATGALRVLNDPTKAR